MHELVTLEADLRFQLNINLGEVSNWNPSFKTIS